MLVPPKSNLFNLGRFSINMFTELSFIPKHPSNVSYYKFGHPIVIYFIASSLIFLFSAIERTLNPDNDPLEGVYSLDYY